MNKRKYIAGIGAALLLSGAMCISVVYAEESAAGTEAPLPLHLKIGERQLTKWNEATQTCQVKINYDQIMLDDEDRLKYPELDKALTLLNVSTQNAQRVMFDLDVSDCDQTGDQYYDDYIISVRRADTAFTSFLYERTSYNTRAVHPFTEYYGYTYDTMTGKQVSISDVVTNLSTIYQENDLMLSNDELNWTLEEDGLTIFLTGYDQGSYSEGNGTIHVSMTQHPELFTDYAKRAMSSYCMSPCEYETVSIDVNGDGTDDSLELSRTTWESYDYADSYTVSVNGSAAMREGHQYDDLNSLMVKHADKTYLIVEEIIENGVRQTAVFELTSGTPVLVQEFPYGFAQGQDSEKYVAVLDWSMDPQDYYINDSGMVTDGFLPKDQNAEASWNGTALVDDGMLTDYILPVEGYRTLYMDINRDGTEDTLQFICDMDEFGFTLNTRIIYNGSEYVDDHYSSGTPKIYLVQKGDKHFLYGSFQQDENNIIAVWDLTDGNINYVGEPEDYAGFSSGKLN